MVFVAVNVNACASVTNCSIHAECHNTKESFLCICNPGFTGNGHYCTGTFFDTIVKCNN